MTEYQTHAALVATLETEIVRLRAVNAELRKSIQAPVQPDTKLTQAARQALEALRGLLAIADDSQGVAGYHLNGEIEPWSGFPEVEEAGAAITALREVLFDNGEPVGHRDPQVAGAVQEPVAWQYRFRPTWGDGNASWRPWKPCTKSQAEDCWKTPVLHDWAYEARALYTAPQPARQPLSDDWIRGLCKESWVFDAAKQWIRIAERAHGIGGEA